MMQTATDLLRRDGHVVIEDVLSRETIEELLTHFVHELLAAQARLNIAPTDADDDRRRGNEDLRRGFSPRGGNQELNRWMLNLPSRPPFMVSDVLANPRVMSVVEDALGPDCVLCMPRSDTALPGSGYQIAHQDHPDLRLSVNFPLVDISDENGPTEVWPGTHVPSGLDVRAPEWRLPHTIPWDEKMDRIKNEKPLRLLAKAGTAIVRDHRQLHRGSPNVGSDLRPMLTFVFIPAPRSLPLRAVTNAAFWLHRGIEAVGAGFGSGRIFPDVLAYANTFRVETEYESGSDRDPSRAIPRATWDALTPRVRTLLRFASVEGTAPSAAREIESTERTWGYLRRMREISSHFLANRGARRQGG